MSTSHTPEENLAALGFALPALAAPAGNYVRLRLDGATGHVSGVVSTGPDGVITGVAGAGRSAEQGYAAAQACGLMLLAVLRQELGSLNRVEGVLQLTGYVAAAPGFTDMPAVLNGASDLVVGVFGEAGRHARTAVGVTTLPRNALIELAAVVKIRD